MRVALNAMIHSSTGRLFCWFLALLSITCSTGRAQEIWEYSPYKVCLWYALDPSIDKSPAGQKELIELTGQLLKTTFGATWELTSIHAPAKMKTLVERGPEKLVVDHFSSSDLVLLLDKDDDSLKTLRVLETAVQQLAKIGMTSADHQQLLLDSQPFVGSRSNVSQTYDASGSSASQKSEGRTVEGLLEKATELFPSYQELLDALRVNRVSAVLVPRAQIPLFAESTRSVATVLPWHTERVLREYEKLFLVNCTREGERYRVAVRELDCPMRLFGPVMTDETVAWNNLAHVITDDVVRAFAPVARIEETVGKVVQLLNRAGGLADEANPARILPGDVLQPVIRREDRRGTATLLEPIPWTYIGVTKADGINVEGTAYSALGNVLQGKQTRRAQRVALRVRPTGMQSDIKIVVRTNPSDAQAGCQIYQRDLMTEELRFLGYTDWRGVITIERPDPLGGILPEQVRLERAAARRAAAEAADKAALEAAAAQQALEAKGAAPAAPTSNTPKPGEPKPDDEDLRSTPTDNAPPEALLVEGAGSTAPVLPADATPATAAGSVDPMDAERVARSVPLRQPLMLLYVKSGDTILARLPLVPGLNAVDVADLPSDARRLEAEAILRGFQAEIMDLIGKRAILSARVGQFLKERKFDEIEEVIKEARQLRDYKSMADTLDGLQRRLLDETKEPVPMAAKSRIDRMTQTTRDMLQKYLENDLPQKLERDTKLAKASAAADEKAANDAAAAAAARAAAEKAAAKPADKPANGSSPESNAPTSISPAGS